jgi:hypothetical protein
MARNAPISGSKISQRGRNDQDEEIHLPRDLAEVGVGWGWGAGFGFTLWLW